jgi:short-subunit dehydrogenase
MKRPLLVLGATGVIGRSVVAAAVEAAVPVIAVARDRVRLDALRTSFPRARIEVIANTLVDDVAGYRLGAAVRELDRPLAGVVAALCGTPGRGRLLDQPVTNLRNEIEDLLLPHLAAARHLLPLMAEQHRSGNYVLVGGPGSEAPWAGYGPRSVTAAALRMLALVLHDEARSLGVRVQLLTSDAPACTSENQSHACPRWPKVAEIGKRAMQLAMRNEQGVGARPVVPLQAHPIPLSTITAARLAKSQRHDDRSTESQIRSREQASLEDARSFLETLIPTNNNEASR